MAVAGNALLSLFSELGCDDAAAELPSDEAAADDAHMLRLPLDLLRITAELLNARDLHAMGGACRRLTSLAAPLVPGLRLRLFDHQRRSLLWMRRCEQRAGLPGGLPRGGILADEPGTGKTVTTLALLAKTASSEEWVFWMYADT